MKFVVFGAQSHIGLLVGNRVLDLALAAENAKAKTRSNGSIFASLLSVIEAGDEGLDLVRELAETFRQTDQPGLYVDLSTAQLQAPFPGQRLAMAGSNFAAHIANAYTNFGKPTTAADIYKKSRQGKAGGFWVVSRPVGTNAKIPVPRSADGLFDYEGEVAIVLGKGGKRIAADGWADRIWGTTLLIDWSVRSQDLFSSQRPFYAHKVFDCSKSIGPWIEVDDVDPTCCDIETRVNGEVRQRFNSRDMIHSFGETLEQISEDLTLYPGDMLSSGTGPGTAADTTVPRADGSLPLDRFLKAGDVVEVTSPNLGSLKGHVVANP